MDLRSRYPSIVFEDDEDEENIKSKYPSIKFDQDAPKKSIFKQIDELIPKLYQEGPRIAREFATGVGSGVSVGATDQLFPQEEPQDTAGSVARGVGEFAGSFLPISKALQAANIASRPLVNLAMKSPILGKQMASLANLVGVGLSGAVYEGAKDVVSGKELTAEDLATHGTIWAALDAALMAAGKTGAFAKSLISTARNKGMPVQDLANELGQNLKGVKEGDIVNKAFELLENPSKSAYENLSNKKITQEFFNKVSPEAAESVKIDFPVTENVESIVQEMKAEGKAGPYTKGLTPVESDKELGERIKSYIDGFKERAEELYKPLYEQAESLAARIFHEPTVFANTAGDTLISLESLKTKPEGYQKVIRSIETALEDAGYTVSRNPATGAIERITAQEGGVPVSKLMELGRRLSKIADYDVRDFKIIDRLKPAIAALKQDIRKGLSQDTKVLEAFNKAEMEYAKTAKALKTPGVEKVRMSELPENIASAVKSPSVLQDLKGVLNEEQLKQVEQRIVGAIAEANASSAQKMLRNFRPYLSEEANAYADQLILEKVKGSSKSSPNLKNQMRDKIYQELADSSITGQAPTKALKLYATPRGKEYVKDILSGTQNKKEITNYLDQKLFADAIQSFTKNGKIDAKKLGELLKDKSFIESIEAVAGKEGVERLRFLQNNMDVFGSYANKIKSGEIVPKDTSSLKGSQILRDASNKEAPLKNYFEKLEDFVGPVGKGIMGALGFTKYGLVGTAGSLAIYNGVKKIATDRRVYSALKTAATAAKTNKTNPIPFILAVENLVLSSGQEP